MPGPQITREDIPFELLENPNGTGCFAEFKADGTLEELYCVYNGVRGGPTFSHDGPNEASLHSGNDASWVYKGTMLEQFSKFDDSSKPYPCDWSEWVEESLAHIGQYPLINIADEVRGRASYYLQWKAPQRSRMQKWVSMMNRIVGLVDNYEPTPPIMPRELQEKLEKINGGL